METILTWISRAFMFGTVLMYGSMGETLTEKSGNMNLGIPGVMCMGAAGGFISAFLYENGNKAPSAIISIFLALLGAFITAALAGALFCFLTTTLRANQNVTGLALTIFGTGISKFFGIYVVPKGATSVKAVFANEVFTKRIPGLSKLGIFGRIFFDYGFMFYLAIAIAILLHLFLKKTKRGLNLRAVGENPATADASGINVAFNKYMATCIGSGIAGLGGLYYVVEYNNGGWSTDSAVAIERLGWLAVALVIFSSWKPINLIWGSVLFGLLYWMYNYVSVFGLRTNSAQSSLLEMIPYVITIVILIISSMKKKKENQPPESLGLSYFREDR